MDLLVRDGIELLLVVAVGGMLVSALVRLRRGQIRVVRCRACGHTTSRAYPNCKHCGVARSERGPGD